MKRIGLLLSLTLLLLLSFPRCAAALTTELRVGFNDQMPPYQFLDEHGQPAGLHIDLMNAIAEQNDFLVEYLPFSKNQAAREALNDGELDLVLGVLMNRSDTESAWFTKSLTSSTICAATKKKNLDENGELRPMHPAPVVFQYGTIVGTNLWRDGVDYSYIVGEQVSALRMLREDRAVLLMGDKFCLRYLLLENGAEADYVILSNYVAPVDYTIKVADGDRQLLRQINDSLDALRSTGSYESLYDKWITPLDQDRSRLILLRKFCIALAVVLSAALIYAYMSRRIRKVLRQRVARQTEELEKHVLLLESESRLREMIIESMANGTVLFGRNGAIRLANSRALHLVERSAAEGSIWDYGLFTQLLRHAVNDGFSLEADCSITEETAWCGRFFETGPATRRRIYRYSLCPVRSVENGAWLLTARDVTREEERKQEVFEQDKNRVLNRMISGIAHEIKNPLTGIRNFAELAESHYTDREYQEAFSEYVPQEIDRISKLIDDLLHYAAPARGLVTRIDLREFVIRCQKLAGYESRSVRPQVEIATAAPLWIEADRDQLQQVFVNMLVNSMESLERKGGEAAGDGFAPRLLIRLGEEGDNALVSIEDNGAGMTREELDSCTEPFFTTKSKGTGLGLALSKQLIQKNGGVLLIESEAGRFARMTMCFRKAAV